MEVLYMSKLETVTFCFTMAGAPSGAGSAYYFRNT